MKQSPTNALVDTTRIPRAAFPKLDFRRSVLSFGTAPLNFYFNCETEFRECTEITYNMTTYNMLQMHGDVPSEHHIGGIPYPLELHFVHESKKKDSLAFSVLFEFGDEPNELLQTLIDAADGLRQLWSTSRSSWRRTARSARTMGL